MKEPENHVVRLASSMRGHYKDPKALEALIAQGDPVHYEVFERNVPEEPGQLQFCISKTYPGTVGGECFMTKGHYHAGAGHRGDLPLPAGRGVHADEARQRRERVRAVPARAACATCRPSGRHRTVNTGDEPLISFCVYPAEAGHNYGDIEKEGFPVRVFKRAGKVADRLSQQGEG